MQVVIKISETLKDIADKDDIKTFSHFMWQSILIDAIKNSTPVQKGHKIIDACALQEHLALVPMEDRTYREAVEIIDKFPSITEADRSEGV
jgi:hypothetical protein